MKATEFLYVKTGRTVRCTDEDLLPWCLYFTDLGSMCLRQGNFSAWKYSWVIYIEIHVHVTTAKRFAVYTANCRINLYGYLLVFSHRFYHGIFSSVACVFILIPTNVAEHAPCEPSLIPPKINSLARTSSELRSRNFFNSKLPDI